MYTEVYILIARHKLILADMVIQSVITRWCASIQMIIKQMGHIINNSWPLTAITMIAAIESVITRWCVSIQMIIMQIQPHSPHNTHIYEIMLKSYYCYYKLCPPQMTAASQRASCAVTRERQIQINYILLICDFFFHGQSHSVCKTFFTTKTLFLSVIYSITDTNNNSPKEMKCKQRNMHLYYNVIVSLD